MIALRTLERILSIMKSSYPLITKLLLFLSISRIPSNIFFLSFEVIFRSTWFLIINCSIKYLRYSWNNIFHIYENTKINEVFSKLSHHSEEINTEKFLQFFSSHFTFHPDSSITFKLNYARYITDNQTKRYSQRFDNTLNSLSTYNSPRAIYLPSVSGARTFGVGQEGKDESSSKARHWKRTKGSELSRQKRENNRTRFVDGASRDNDNGGRKGGGSKDVPSTFDCPSPRCPCPVERHGIAGRCRGQTSDVISRENRPRSRSEDFPGKYLVSSNAWFLETSPSIGGAEAIPRREFFGYWGEISANLLTWRT